jgi:thiosulfate dehydrogenase [quinone] large subunit
MLRHPRTVFSWASITITALAGGWTIFHILWSLWGQTANDYWRQALVVLFLAALLLAVVRFVQERSSFTATDPDEEFPDPPIAKFFFASSGAAVLWFDVRMYVGTTWLLSGWTKARSPAWGTSGTALKGFVESALRQTGGTNPEVQGWYAAFLRQVVVPHASLFSFLVTWGELAIGLGILMGALTGIAAGFGVLLNFSYILAGTVGINPLLAMLGLFLCFAWRVAGQLGLDSWLLPALGLPWKPGMLFQSSGVRATSPAT